MKKIYKCCESIDSKIDNVNKGFSFEYEEPYFQMIFWSIDKSKEMFFIDEYRKIDISNKPPNIALNGNVVIKYCPFCGEKLRVLS